MSERGDEWLQCLLNQAVANKERQCWHELWSLKLEAAWDSAGVIAQNIHQVNNVFISISYRCRGVEIVWYVREDLLQGCSISILDLYGVDLPPVSSIPVLKITRQKDYDGSYTNIALSVGEKVDFVFIAKNLHLATSREQHWLDSIQSWVVFRNI